MSKNFKCKDLGIRKLEFVQRLMQFLYLLKQKPMNMGKDEFVAYMMPRNWEDCTRHFKWEDCTRHFKWEDCTRHFKWPSRQRWQCPIQNGSLKPESLINNLEDILVFLGLETTIENNPDQRQSLQVLLWVEHCHFWMESHLNLRLSVT